MIYGQPVTFGGKPDLQEKTVTPSTSQQTVTPDADYDGLSEVTVEAMPTATQATPSITVSSAGLITASATQSAGYVAAGTKSATKQLTVQAAKTVTPTTSNQTAVASGRYTTGAITVKGDSNLKAANIKKGVSIFGVTGTDVGAPVLLWTNASPTSDFDEQTVTVAKGYSGYLIEILHDNDSATSAITYFNVGSSGIAACTEPPGYTGKRFIESVANGSIVFGIGQSNSTTENSDYGIPTRIWGVKWTIS